MKRAAALLLPALLAPALALAAVTASVDRDRLALGESLTLTIEADHNVLLAEPDLAPLAQDFSVQPGISRSSQVQVANGKVSTRTRFQAVLLPRRSGGLVIPPLALGNERTGAIAIDVRPAGARTGGSPAAGADPVQVTATLDDGPARVNGQRIVTVRGWFRGIAAGQVVLEPPQGTGFRLEPLGDATSFRQQLDGADYDVVEQRYALLPQQAGTLEVPPFVLGAIVADDRSFGGFLRIPGGRRIVRQSPPLVLQVADTPAGLPVATGVDTRLSWSHEPGALETGVPATLTLVIEARGTPADLLPAPVLPAVPGLRAYAEQPQRETRRDSDGLQGRLVQTWALLPERAGAYSVAPAPWAWIDAADGSARQASWQATRLQVRGGTAAPASRPAAADAAPASGPARAQHDPLAGSPWLASLLAASLAGNAVLGWLWWRRRHRAGGARAAEAAVPAPAAAADWRDLLATGTAGEVRQALVGWAARSRPEALVRDLGDLRRLLPAHRVAISALERALYDGGGDDGWRKALAAIPDDALRETQARARAGALSPLWPDGKA